MIRRIIFSIAIYISVFNYSAAALFPPDSVAPPTLADFTYAAKIARPSVVHIKTYSSKQAQGNSQLEDFFKEFYGDQYNGQQPTQPQSDEPELQASGSGVIIDANGIIITNNHIVEGAERIDVVLNDKRAYHATIVGTDETTDIAIIKINETGLNPMTYGNSEITQIGDWVLAVGNPFNLTSTVTAGIISAKGRNINILGGGNNMAIESFIQTDAAVNPGNSGGALVNLQGKLIGINTAIASPTGAFAGYSFAVPVNLVRKVVIDLMEFGQVQRGLLGVMIRDLNAELGKEKEIENLRGVYVEDVNENSAAEVSGLKVGDIITSVNGIEVNNPAQLQEVVALYRPGDKITIKYRRNGKEKETEATLRNKAGSIEVVRFDPNSIENRIGAILKDVESGELKKLKIAGGAQVTGLKAGKLREAGVKDGFIITHIDKQKVASVKEALTKLEKTQEAGVLLEGIYPSGEKAFYAVGM